MDGWVDGGEFGGEGFGDELAACALWEWGLGGGGVMWFGVEEVGVGFHFAVRVLRWCYPEGVYHAAYPAAAISFR